MRCKTRVMAASDLVKAVRDDQRAQEHAKKTKEALHDAVEDSISIHGWSVIDVMDVTGLSRQRITQIRKQVRERRAKSQGR